MKQWISRQLQCAAAVGIFAGQRLFIGARSRRQRRRLVLVVIDSDQRALQRRLEHHLARADWVVGCAVRLLQPVVQRLRVRRGRFGAAGSVLICSQRGRGHIGSGRGVTASALVGLCKREASGQQRGQLLRIGRLGRLRVRANGSRRLGGGRR